jgi:ATP-dependent DNA ligase
MVKAFKKLFSRDSTGKIRVWYQEQDGHKYRTISGLEDGEKVTSEWTTVEGKNVGRSNETSATEQATAEIEAKYKKQLKTGYTDTVGDVDDTGFQEPMLAKKLKDRLNKLTFPAMLDRKYNGGRVNAKKDGLFTRKGERWKTIPHIFDSLKPLFIKYPKLFLDGEGYNHEYRFHLNDLMSVMRKTVKITDEDLKKSEEMVKLYVYDGYGFDDITAETGNRIRRDALKKLLKGYKYIVVVDYEIVKDLDELYNKYQEYVDDGYEGAMYRELNGAYEHKRSSNLLKVKPEDDSEAIITDVTEGTGNWSGVAKTATIKWKNQTFDATFKGSYEELQKLDMLHNKKKFIGQEVTFLYNGLTGKGIPNYARIDVNNCFKK